jgi:hypothetical protein
VIPNGVPLSLIESATTRTYTEWILRYGALPAERLRTEVDAAAIESSNPGYCYLRAGWIHDRWVGTKRYLLAPAL